MKIVLLAYSRGIITSRKIMEACRENIVFMALSADSMPDFTTISTFVRDMKDEVKKIFTNVLLVCDDMNLLGGTEFNTIRPHEALGMKRPTDVYVKSGRKYEPEDVLIVYGKGYKRRMVNDRGFCNYKGKRFFAGNPFAGQL